MGSLQLASETLIDGCICDPYFLAFSISHTTRPMREGSDKQEYYFVEEGVFSVMTGKVRTRQWLCVCTNTAT